MGEHSPRATEYAWKWCATCQRMTGHIVSGGTTGACLAHRAKELTREQLRRRDDAQRPKPGNLFEGRC